MQKDDPYGALEPLNKTTVAKAPVAKSNQLDSNISLQQVMEENLLNEEEDDPINIKLIQSPSRKFTYNVPYAERGFATIISCVANLSNTILGAGTLGLPYAVAQCGIEIGLMLFCVFGCFSAFGLYLLSQSGREFRNCDFSTLSRRTIPWAKRIVDVAVAIKCFGVGTSYIIVIGDLMPEAMQFLISNHDWKYYSLFNSRRFWIALFMAIFVLPLIRLRNFNGFRYTSALCLMTMVYIAIVIVLYFAFPNTFNACAGIPIDECKGEFDHSPHDIKKFLGVLSIFVFSFTCHQNIFPITNELKNPNNKRLNSVIILSILVCLTFYCVVSYSGYHTYGSNVKSDILENYPRNTMFTVVRIALSVNLALSYPLQCHPFRMAVSQLAFKENIFDLYEKNRYKFYAITYGMAICSFIVSMIVKNLSFVLALVGGTGSTTISYILPGFFYYYTFNNETTWIRKLSFVFGVFGCLLVPFSLAMVFWSGEGG